MNNIIQGDSLEVLKTLPSESVDCAITSPPYWALRNYGVDGQLGLEPTFQEYINKLCDMFDEVKRVLKKEGTCWVNLGDTYSGNKEGKTDNKVSDYLKDTTKNLHKKKGSVAEKCLCQIPSRFAIEMTNRGWILRNEIIWHKPNCMPSSVTDRFTVDFEKVFFFVKSKKYQFDNEAVMEKSIGSEKRAHGIVRDREYDYNSKLAVVQKRKRKNGVGIDEGKGKNGEYGFNCGVRNYRNKRAVWTVQTMPFADAHFATFPEKLIEPMIKAGCPVSGIVLDIFMGAGTTGLVAKKLGRNYLGVELNPAYIKIAEDRINGQTPPML